MKKCPKGSRKNKKTGNCDPISISNNPLPTSTSIFPSLPSLSQPISNEITTSTTPTLSPPPPITTEIKKTKKCSKGTRKNKKTGNCDPILSSVTVSPLPSPETNIPISTILSSSQIPLPTVSYTPKTDWEKNTTTIIKNEKGKSYQYLVVPKNTYIYRGFTYGDNPYNNPYRLQKDDPEYLEMVEEMKRYNEEYYQRFKQGIYYGNLGVACFYAYNPDYSNSMYHYIQEYTTKKSLSFLDMNNWQNLKNIVDTYSSNNTNSSDEYTMEEILEICYGFDINDSSKLLYRDSGGVDTNMTKMMIQWFQQNKQLKLHGFGHTKIHGFHSEVICLDSKNVSLVKEYMSENYKENFMKNVKDAKDVLPLDNIYFLEDGYNNKKIYIQR